MSIFPGVAEKFVSLVIITAGNFNFVKTYLASREPGLSQPEETQRLLSGLIEACPGNPVMMLDRSNLNGVFLKYAPLIPVEGQAGL